MNNIVFNNVKKAYDGVTVIEKLNLEILDGERFILLGPSGCGKTTTLRMIAGFEDITSGELRLRDQVVNDIPSGKRNIAMVFQNYALYPHMSVEKNITYALKKHNLPREEIAKRLKSAAGTLGLMEYLDRKPAQLSGGQRQRVALARALVKRSNYLLLDEPLSNLDAKLRVSAREELIFLHEQYKQTFVYVTHDQEEAMTLADRICILNKGEIQMVDTPTNIYNRPKNVFVASFIGSPGMNIMEAEYKDGHLIVENYPIVLNDYWKYKLERRQQNKYYFGIRAEKIQLSNEHTPDAIKVKILLVEDIGRYYHTAVEINGKKFTVSSNEKIGERNEIAYFTPNPKSFYLFDFDSQENIEDYAHKEIE